MLKNNYLLKYFKNKIIISFFLKNDKELKQKIINREPLKDSFLDNETSKELKAILNMMYDKVILI